MLTFPLTTRYTELGLRHVLVFKRGDHDDHTLIASNLDELSAEFAKLVTYETVIHEYLYGEVVPPSKQMADKYACRRYRLLFENSKISLLCDAAVLVEQRRPLPEGLVPCKPCDKCLGLGVRLKGTWRDFVKNNPQILEHYHRTDDGFAHPVGKGEPSALVYNGWQPDRLLSYSDWMGFAPNQNILFMHVHQDKVPQEIQDLIDAEQQVEVEDDETNARKHAEDARKRAEDIYQSLKGCLEFPAV